MPDVVRYVVRKFWTITAALLIALAVLVQLGREFSAYLGHYSDNLAAYLESRLGMPVQLQTLSGQIRGLNPTLGIAGLQVSSPEGVPVLTIGRALARLDLLNSFYDRRLVWGELELEQVQMLLVQQEDGSWTVEGVGETTAVRREDSGEPIIDDPLDVFLLGPHIALRNAEVTFAFRSGHRTQLAVPKILLENTDDFHRLTLSVDIDERKDAVTLVLEGQGDPRDKEAFVAKGYLNVQQLPTEKMLALLANRYWQGLPDQAWRSSGRLDLDIWLASRPGGGFELEGGLVLAGLPMEQSQGSIPLEHLEAELKGAWQPGGAWSLAVQNTRMQWGEQPPPSLDLSVGASGLGEPLAIKLAQLDVGLWHQLFSSVGLLQGSVEKILSDLKPKGTLSSLALTVPLDHPQDWHLQANLQQASVDAWKGAPALTRVDGYVEANREGGFVELDSRQGFSMHYPLIYHDAMHYQSARGQVSWSLQPENNAIYVNSGLLSFEGDDGQANGFFHLYTPWKKGTASTEIILQIGLQNSQAKYHKKYVPFTLPQSLRSWLDESLGEGQVVDGGFVYRGSLKKEEPEKRTAQLYLNIAEADLHYHRQWPALEGLGGLLTVDDVNVNARVDSGRLYNSTLGRTLIAVAPNPIGKGSLLGIRGQVKGPAGDGLQVLRESPLREALGSTFDTWSLDGKMAVDLTLSIPLERGAPGELQQVKVDLQEADLDMENLRLRVDQLAGRIEYSNQAGLSATGLQGQLWQQPVVVDISSPTNSAGGWDTLVNMRGKVKTASLASWTGRPELLYTQGETAYVGQLRVPAKQAKADYQALLNVSSNLRGVAIDLPAPFGKPKERDLPLQVRVPLSAEKTLFDIRLGELAQGLFVQGAEAFEKGVVALGQGATLPDARRLDVVGKIGQLELAAWQEVWQRYQDYEQQLNAHKEAEEPLDSDFGYRLDMAIDRFVMGDFHIDSLALTGSRDQSAWNLQAVSDTASGQVTLFHDDTRPLAVDLEYLRLPAPAGDEVEPVSLVQPITGLGADPSVEVTQLAQEEVPAAESSVGALPQREAAANTVAEVTEGTTSEQSPLAAEPMPEEAEVDPLAEVDLSQLIAVDFATREFRIGDEDYGSWAFQLRPTDKGVEAINIEAQIRGTRIGGLRETDGARLSWTQQDGLNKTAFFGRLTASNLSDVMAQWKQPKLIESDSARFDVDLTWQGSPANISLAGLQGDLSLQVRKGRFNRTTGAGSSAFLRLMSLLNFDTLVRRLQLDFSDVYKSGMAYDDIRARMHFKGGGLYLSDPLRVKTPSSKLQLAGTIDLAAETMDTTLVATLPVGENLTLLTALAAGLPAAAGVYVASKLFAKQVDRVASISYTMRGPWSEPDIDFDKMFDSKAAKKVAKTTQQAEDRARVEAQQPPQNPELEDQ